MTSLVATTWDAVVKARSEADFYRISINLQQLATPGDVKQLLDGSATVPPGNFRAWLENLYRWVTLHEQTPFVFGRRDLSKSVSLYSGENGAKTLVIGFCGRAQLLCAPLPVILQYFPPDLYDVLVLRDPNSQGFVDGIAGYSASFASLLEKIEGDVNLGDYDSIRCWGTSGGAAAALAAGIRFEASRRVSFCGRPPTSSSFYGRKPAALDLEARLKKSSVAKGRAFGVYGASHSQDKNNALQLARLMEIALIPIDGLSDHIIIHPLHLRGELGGVFQKVGLI
jgi:hypothetical protein